MLNEKSILITGGTGTFGKAFAKELLVNYPKVRRLVIYSRDELKQYEMSHELPKNMRHIVRFFIGDIRDQERIKRALEGIDIVIHAAALKQVPAAEYNPFECIKTNILGAQNLIESALDVGVKKVIALSTDKAAAPINLYGATKLCSDKLFIAANNIRGSKKISFSVVRYGNVMGSRGSVVPFFQGIKKTGTLPVTHPEMTRFNISLKAGVEMVLWAIENSRGGEIFVPKLPSYRVMDLAKAIAPDCKIEIIGVRPGEKIHEEMITSSDSYNTVDLGRYFVILPGQVENEINQYCIDNNASLVTPGFSYNSYNNNNYLSVQELESLVQQAN